MVENREINGWNLNELPFKKAHKQKAKKKKKNLETTIKINNYNTYMLTRKSEK